METLWNYCQVKSKKDLKTKEEILLVRMLLFIWQKIELDAMYARKTSVPVATPSHITWVNCAGKLMLRNADSAKKNSSNHLLV